MPPPTCGRRGRLGLWVACPLRMAHGGCTRVEVTRRGVRLARGVETPRPGGGVRERTARRRGSADRVRESRRGRRSRARSRAARGRHLRPAPLQPCPARRAPRRHRAWPRRAWRRPPRSPPRRSRRAPCSRPRTAGALEYFAPVAAMPGFAPALARSLQRPADGRCRGAGRSSGRARADVILPRCTTRPSRSSRPVAPPTAPRLFSAAREVLESGASFCEGRAVVLVDVAIDTPVERAFVAALLGRASAMARVRAGRGRVHAHSCSSRSPHGWMSTRMRGDGELTRLRRHLFQRRCSPLAPNAGPTSSSSPRPARAARPSRSRATCSTKRAAACASTRWPCCCARRGSTWGCSSTRSRVPASPRRSAAAHAGRIPPAAPCSPCCRAPTRTSRRTASPSTCPWRRCRTRRPAGPLESDVEVRRRRGPRSAG